jgi:hypothetical protein
MPAVNPTPTLTQAAGATTLQVQKTAGFYQIYVETSATPTAGTLAVSYACEGSNTFMPLLDAEEAAITINLTAPQPVVVEGVFIDKFKFTPTGFDADKTYKVFVATTQTQQV